MPSKHSSASIRLFLAFFLILVIGLNAGAQRPQIFVIDSITASTDKQEYQRNEMIKITYSVNCRGDIDNNYSYIFNAINGFDLNNTNGYKPIAIYPQNIDHQTKKTVKDKVIYSDKKPKMFYVPLYPDKKNTTFSTKIILNASYSSNGNSTYFDLTNKFFVDLVPEPLKRNPWLVEIKNTNPKNGRQIPINPNGKEHEDPDGKKTYSRFNLFILIAIGLSFIFLNYRCFGLQNMFVLYAFIIFIIHHILFEYNFISVLFILIISSAISNYALTSLSKSDAVNKIDFLKKWSLLFSLWMVLVMLIIINASSRDIIDINYVFVSTACIGFPTFVISTAANFKKYAKCLEIPVLFYCLLWIVVLVINIRGLYIKSFSIDNIENFLIMSYLTCFSLILLPALIYLYQSLGHRPNFWWPRDLN